MDEDEYFEDGDDTEGDELWLGACYMAGSVCFRMISAGEHLNGATLSSTLKAAQAEDYDHTSPGALSLQLAIEQLENSPPWLMGHCCKYKDALVIFPVK